MTTIGFLAEGFREASRRARVRKQERARNAVATARAAGQTAAKSVTTRIGHVWLTLTGLALGSAAAWQIATWAGLLATAAACVIAERVIGIGD